MRQRTTWKQNASSHKTSQARGRIKGTRVKLRRIFDKQEFLHSREFVYRASVQHADNKNWLNNLLVCQVNSHNQYLQTKRKALMESWEDISLIWSITNINILREHEQKTKVRDCLILKLKAACGYRNEHPSSFGRAVSEKEWSPLKQDLRGQHLPQMSQSFALFSCPWCPVW